jgi:hypothetical protein
MPSAGALPRGAVVALGEIPYPDLRPSRWLRELDASIEQGPADADAERVDDLDDACDAIVDGIRTKAAARSR